MNGGILLRRGQAGRGVPAPDGAQVRLIANQCGAIVFRLGAAYRACPPPPAGRGHDRASVSALSSPRPCSSGRAAGTVRGTDKIDGEIRRAEASQHVRDLHLQGGVVRFQHRHQRRHRGRAQCNESVAYDAVFGGTSLVGQHGDQRQRLPQRLATAKFGQGTVAHRNGRIL